MYITSYSIRLVLLSRYVNIYGTMAPMSGIGLLALIQAVSFNKNAAEGTHGLLSVVRADKKPYLIYQKPNESPSEWIQSFQANIKSAEATGGKIGGGEHVSQYLADLEGVDLTKLAPDKLAEFKERATTMYQVLLCFNGINREKYGAVKNRILNNSLLRMMTKAVCYPRATLNSSTP